CLQHDTYPLTF
nr:immunoglobulin light chain junction region [Macaca mulatta]